MNKFITFLVLLISLMLTACQSNITSISIPDKRPNAFNFILEYGVGAKNKIDTFSGKYTKDMVADPSITIDLKLKDEELDLIYSEIKRTDIINYPDVFKEKTNAEQTPYQTYKFKFQVNDKVKEFYWEDKDASNSIKATEVRELFNKIAEIIYNKDEYKKLPEPRSGYL